MVNVNTILGHKGKLFAGTERTGIAAEIDTAKKHEDTGQRFVLFT
jgi:hypothetical protein